MIECCPQCGRARQPNYRFCPQCGFPIEQIDEAPSDPLIGMTLGGAYVLLEKIGSGGMGAVYRAEQRTLGRTVAVKVIHGHLLHDPVVAERFFNEAHAASRLSHPNVVGVIDFGKTSHGLPYLVMEHLRGKDLRTVLRDSGLMELGRVVEVLQQVLAALAEAHDLNIVHRDLKPANIVLEPTRAGGDFVKVVDFGLAKILQGSSERALATGGLVRGTPSYMAPEQASGGAIDARTDIYAVGVTLFELLTGRPPFEADSPPALMLKHVHETPPDPRDVAPLRAIPQSLARITLRALAKNPEDRFQTADDFARALRSSDSAMAVDGCAYPTIPVPGRADACPSCGEPLSASQKFCGGCGAQVSSRSGSSDSWKPPSVPSSHLRMGRGVPRARAGADEHLPWLQDFVVKHREGAGALRIVGDDGSGRTTLLRELVAFGRGQGDVVASIGPDPWWAEPGYHALRHLILQLVRLPCDGKDPLGWAGAGPEAVLGLQNIFLGVTDDPVHPSATHRLGACAALLWALERARQGSLTGRILVVVDDLERIDGASRNALGDALEAPVAIPWVVVATHTPRYEPSWRMAVPERLVQGIPLAGARKMLGSVGAPEEALGGGAWCLPLLVEQILRSHLDGLEHAPCGLADLVGLRIASLRPSARAVMDALCVLGDDVPIEDLVQVVDPGCDVDDGLLALAVGGYVDRGPGGLCWVHPIFRQVTRLAMPAGVRRALYDRAADLYESRGAPMEVRAMFALEAERGLEALFLLECVARTAQLRGDHEGTIRALRAGYSFARQTHRDSGIEQPDRAVVVFGRKLGEALLDAGRLPEAEMLLREVLVVADDNTTGDVLRGLARVASADSREHDARVFLDEADTHAKRKGVEVRTKQSAG